MTQKRKASNNTTSEPSNAAFESRGPKLHLSTYEDVADSEDEFLTQRDKILLDEGPDAKRRRKMKEEGNLLLLLHVDYCYRHLLIDSTRNTPRAIRRRSPRAARVRFFR